METILLAYDDTPSAQGALERAAELAAALDARLVVTSVAPVLLSVGRSAGVIDPADPPEAHARALEQARSYLDRRGVNAEYINAVGEPATRIVDVATSCHADLIVVGSRQPRRLGRLVSHTLSDRVLRKATCAVLVVRTRERQALGSGAESLRDQVPMGLERIAA